MDVQLFVYDLSKGMARQMSLPLLGIQIDAVYHTSLVFGGVEYFFGYGMQRCFPGSTHHGRPMDIIPLGRTELPEDVISEYLESLRQIYTPESYDLFTHNCNNFTNELAMFLVGKGIPEHITNLPQTVLNTPFGQMLRPQIDASMRRMTQAPVPPQNIPSVHNRRSNGANGTNPSHVVNGNGAVTLPISPVSAFSESSLSSTEAAHGLVHYEKAFPSHPHLTCKVPTLQSGSLRPVTFTKTPPLDKLTAKLGAAGHDPAAVAIKTFVSTRNAEGAEEAAVPDLPRFSAFFRNAPTLLQPEVLFAALDLLRCALLDPRVSGWFAEESPDPTIPALIDHVNNLENCPYNLRLVTTQLACNLFSTPLYPKHLLDGASALGPSLIRLVADGLLDVEHANLRSAAASLAFNLAAANYRVRRQEQREGLSDSELTELVASLLHTLYEQTEAVRQLVLALGYLVYCAPLDSVLVELCRAMDAMGAVEAKKDDWPAAHRGLLDEILLLLDKPWGEEA
ncbi:hypothetical protein LTR66_002059 [Elasticomyces elasticus]|nr:hypothetical protein LTR66_002059 [Elasticomyces elasticus]